MGPDDDVHGPIGKTRDRGRLCRCRHEPRQEPDLEREGREPLRERGEVLGGEHGRRHEDRHLRPSWTALNAARSATSVLPYPTSPTTSRSIGRPSSMSALASAAARA